MKKYEVIKTTDSNKAIVTYTIPEEGDPVEINRVEYDLPEKKSAASLKEANDYMKYVTDKLQEIEAVWDDAKAEGDYTAIARGLIFADASSLCDLHNKVSLEEAMRDCKESGNPMLRAVERLSYDTISVRETTVDEITTLTTSVRKRRIPLEKLHKRLGGIGVDPNWIYKGQTVNMLFTARAIASCNKDNPEQAEEELMEIKDSFGMHEVAKKIKMGETPTSTTQILKALRETIGMMIGTEYTGKVLSYDVRHISDLYITEYKKDVTGQTKQTRTHKQFFDLLLIIAHRVFTDGKYKVYYPEKNKQK